jgi:hypothetical protein
LRRFAVLRLSRGHLLLVSRRLLRALVVQPLRDLFASRRTLRQSADFRTG